MLRQAQARHNSRALTASSDAVAAPKRHVTLVWETDVASQDATPEPPTMVDTGCGPDEAIEDIARAETSASDVEPKADATRPNETSGDSDPMPVGPTSESEAIDASALERLASRLLAFGAEPLWK